ncbi:MAG: polysaccharide deacetylase family protein [Patescibacteria group bacterium]
MEVLPPLSRRTFLKALGVAPFTAEPFLSLLQEREVRLISSVLTYHEVNAAKMTSDVVSLIRRGYQPLSLDTFVGALRGEVEIPQGLPTFLVTCDDGLFSQYTQGLQAVDTIERQTGYFVPLTLFTMTRFEGLPITEDLPDEVPSFNDGRHRYMNKGQLVDMLRKGHYLQNHTADHMSVTQLPEDRLRDQIEVSEGKIDLLWELAERERTVKAFAYPNGRYAGREGFIQDAGFDVAFTTAGITQHSSANPFRLGRLSR